MKVLVLQARPPGDTMLEHEQQCFARATGLDGDTLRFVNVAIERPSMALLDGLDALLVGGSGHFSVTRPDQPFFAPMAELLLEVVERGLPTFASCFGFQLLATALGGSVINDPARREVGSFRIALTADGRQDPLFGSLPAEFTAQQGHVDRVERLPAGVLHLAASERSPYQALRVQGKPIWATQFHPELDQAGNYRRYLAYIAKYGPSAFAEPGHPFTNEPSPEVDRLLATFVRHVLPSA